ncbi:hypothetical protein Cgig2_009816 [Carnegiea gigantea]|uniref:RING-type domain-containing protein n=1 Tax=Carnegiea gigantea TaxID=171969 RepID=A0A9Q1JQ45_9CARY|nr:hypothetical protein Cgig2_009816 [Carnegiea gigantea]
MANVHATASLLLSTKTSLPSSPAISAEPPVPVYSPDMAIILACLICALICTVGLMAMARCTWLRHPCHPTTAPSAAFKRAVVDSLPRLVFKPGGKNEAARTVAECVICLGVFVDGEQIRVLPGCSHAFHVACIDRWLLGTHSSSCCPSCRQVLVTHRKGINE